MAPADALMRFLKRSAPRAIFATWQEASRASGDGYQEKRLLAVVHEKTRRYRDAVAGGPVVLEPGDATVALGVALAASDRQLSVLDFGGACGSHFFMARAVLPQLKIRWSVVETPGMVDVAQDFQDQELSFATDIRAALGHLGAPDLVLCSGALQYAPDPRATLRELLDCRARMLVLTRLMLADHRDVVTIQRSLLSANGRGDLPPGLHESEVQYPITFVKRQDIEAMISSAYRIRARFVEEGGEMDVAGGPVKSSGYIAQRLPD